LRLAVVTMVYNEHILWPLFLLHYIPRVHSIHVLLDTDSDPAFLKAVRDSTPAVSVYDHRFPDGMDDFIKQNAINALAETLDATWILAVDADEFVWPELGEPPPGIAYQIPFVTVYRHRSDDDLDLSREPLFQRRHGDPLVGRAYGRREFIKPCLVRREFARWLPGCHALENPGVPVIPFGQHPWRGVHWCMADPSFVIERRIRGRRDRMSAVNKMFRLTVQHQEITEESVRAELEAHLDDPQLF